MRWSQVMTWKGGVTLATLKPQRKVGEMSVPSYHYYERWAIFARCQSLCVDWSWIDYSQSRTRAPQWCVYDYATFPWRRCVKVLLLKATTTKSKERASVIANHGGKKKQALLSGQSWIGVDWVWVGRKITPSPNQRAVTMNSNGNEKRWNRRRLFVRSDETIL